MRGVLLALVSGFVSFAAAAADWYRVSCLSVPVVQAVTNAVPAVPAVDFSEFLLLRNGADSAAYYGTRFDNTNGIPDSATGERIVSREGLAKVRWLEIDDAVRFVPAGAFAGMPDLETVRFDGRVRMIGPRAFADSPKLSCVVIEDAVAVTVAADAFAGCATNRVCLYPFAPVMTAQDGPKTSGAPLFGSVLFRGGILHRRVFFRDGELSTVAQSVEK